MASLIQIQGLLGWGGCGLGGVNNYWYTIQDVGTEPHHQAPPSFKVTCGKRLGK